MCGIAGLFCAPGETGAASPRLLAMRDAMAARGPDDAGFAAVAAGRLLLGHRRLSIIDLSPAGHQPMMAANGAVTIVYNGEIYNYRKLRAELAAQGYAFRSDSDTETILALYLRDGIAMLPRLVGMFALAIWDERHAKLLLARDTHGIKPLYYRSSPTFAFASQVRALLADPATERRLDPDAALGFAVWGAVPEPRTIVAGIAALPAGHWLEVDANGVAGVPKPFLTLPDVLNVGLGDAPQDPRKALAESVARHLVADVEVGCFLSAGVDSGAILGLMRDAGAARMRAITLRFAEFAGSERDEAPLAGEVARLYGAEHLVETIDAADFSASLPLIRQAMDQPSIDGVNSWFVSRSAARVGLKVALSGLGGDELLGGYSTFTSVPATHALVRGIAAVPILGSVARAAARRLFGGKRAMVLDYARTLEGAYLARRAMLMPEDAGSVIERPAAPDARADLLAPLEQVVEAVPGPGIATLSALESSIYMRNQLLRDSDWAGMAHSLEIRLPLVDAALSRAIAPHLARFGPGDGKRLLASAPARALPAAIVDRRKTGFGVPVERWIGGRPGSRLADGWARQVFADYVATMRLEP